MFEWNGFCPICQAPSKFVAQSDWYRDALLCTTCENGSVPRERALALVLEETKPNWRSLIIHESSPAERGISLKLRRQGKNYIGSQYFPDKTPGYVYNGFRNENLQEMTFEDCSHDIFISLDVFEHLPQPAKAITEIHRTLRPNGLMISTFPVRNYQVSGMERRVDYAADGSEIHIKPPEIHGNPVSDEGSIVTVDYGYELHKVFSKWAPFDVRVYRFDDPTHGIVGEYTEVVVCKKRQSTPSPLAVQA